MKMLDFVILGAQKSGTTTLFQLLSEHSGVFVPPGKEVPFFTRTEVSHEAFCTYLSENFAMARESGICGKVTPHYLSDPRVPARIKELLPDAKLVVILRDPVERALSHYRMSVRRGLEARTFEQAMNDMLVPADLVNARELVTGQYNENRTYIVWGEYGRLLTPYAEEIAAGKLLVLFTSELEGNPFGTMEKLLGFLGLEMMELPSLGKKLHQGGERERFPLMSVMRRIKIAKWLWYKLPERHRNHILFSFSQWNVVRSKKDISDMDDVVIARLREHFVDDTEILVRLAGVSVPWQYKN